MLRSLPQLTQADFGDWSAEQLAWLAAEPIPIQLKSVGIIRRVGSAHAASLARLPNLTFLSGGLMLEDASFIGSLRKLQIVDLRCEPQVDVQRLMAALAQCSDISSLTLSHPQLGAAHLATLLPHLPRLDELRFVDCPELRSLSFLSSTPHLTSILSKFVLVNCVSLPPSELVYVQQLGSLEELTLHRSFTSPLDAFTLAAFAPDQPLMRLRANPKLRKFDSTPPS